jgi:hypothetical protein
VTFEQAVKEPIAADALIPDYCFSETSDRFLDLPGVQEPQPLKCFKP